MGVLIVVLIAIMAISAMGAVGSAFGAVHSGVPVIVMIIGILVFGSVLREYVRSRKNMDRASRKDLDEIKARISQIEEDIADIKEQIADFIISQV